MAQLDRSGAAGKSGAAVVSGVYTPSMRARRGKSEGCGNTAYGMQRHVYGAAMPTADA
jgi:hypothetical protein